ncbi:MAG TPA: NAD(P)/FAD-dependent oxidoreductase [Chloroflexia bacterium]|nr:NAD(P)/FAD-dependent oxidoreductase [Chloroflexia bacterium]
MEKMRIAVLGGGALGLTAAMRLARRGAQVTVLEKEGELGGLAAGFLVGDSGTYLEKFYHHLFRSDTAIQDLIAELGLGAKLLWLDQTTATLYRGKLYSTFNGVGDVLRFTPLSFPNRLRLGAGVAYLKAEPDYRRLRHSTAQQWIKRWMGRQVYEVLFGPLLESKFGTYAPQIAAPWFWARIHCRSIQLGYLKGGFQQIYNRLGEEIRAAGGEIRLHTAVTRIAPQPDGTIRVDTATGSEIYDKVVATLPTRLFMKLTEGLPAGYRQRYDWGNALGAHCVVLALTQSLLPRVYWLNLNDPGFPFLAAVEHTNLMPTSDYGGRHLIYLGNYLPMDHRYFTQGDDATIAEFLPALHKLNPAFDPSWVTEHWVLKAPFAQPVVTRDYAAHIPPLTTPIPNLYLGNMFQVYPQDRGQNYSIKLADKLAALIDVEGHPARAATSAVAAGSAPSEAAQRA